MDPELDRSSRRVPQQERAKHKRQALLVAAEQEFAEREYPEVTTKTIAARAGVSAGTFYQYFESKDHILREVWKIRLAIFTDEIVDEDGGLPGGPAPRSIGEHIRQSMALTYRFHADNPRLHGTIAHRRALDPLLERMAAAGDRIILERVTKAVRHWGIANAEEVAFVIVSMAEGLVHRQVFGEVAMPYERVMEQGAEMITRHLERLCRRGPKGGGVS